MFNSYDVIIINKLYIMLNKPYINKTLNQFLVVLIIPSLTALFILLSFHQYLSDPISLYLRYTLIQFFILIICFIILTKFLNKIDTFGFECNKFNIPENINLILLSTMLCIVSANTQFFRDSGHPFVWQAGLEGLAHHDILYRSAQAFIFQKHQILSTGAMGSDIDFGHRLSEIFLGILSFASFTSPLKIYFLFKVGTISALISTCLILASKVVNKQNSTAVLVFGLFLSFILIYSHLDYFQSVRIFINLPQAFGISLFILSFSLCLKLLQLKKLTKKKWIISIIILNLLSMLVIFSKVHLGYVASSTLCMSILLSRETIIRKIVSLAFSAVFLITFSITVLYPTLFYGIGLERDESVIPLLFLFKIFLLLLLISLFFYWLTKQRNYLIYYLCFTLPVVGPPMFIEMSGQIYFFLWALPIITIIYFASILHCGILSSNKLTIDLFRIISTKKVNVLITIFCLLLLSSHLFKYPFKNSFAFKKYVTNTETFKESESLNIIHALNNMDNIALVLKFEADQYKKIGYSCKYPFLVYQAYLGIPIFAENFSKHIQTCHNITEYGIYPKLLKNKYAPNEICEITETYNVREIIYINIKGEIIKTLSCTS